MRDELDLMGESLRHFFLQCEALLDDRSVRRQVEETLTPAERAGLARFPPQTTFPMLMRPDLIVDAENRLHIAEVDIQPAHAGMLQRMQEIHAQKPTIAEIWAEMIREPVVLSIPKWKRFCAEQQYFANRVQGAGGQMDFLTIEDWNRLNGYSGILFKNCCTLDLLNETYPPFIPSQATLCPPLLLDWKGWLALASDHGRLRRKKLTCWIPESYLLPLHPEHHAEKRRAWLDLRHKEKAKWIIKPVGSWGGRGFHEGEQLSRERWNQFLLGLPPADAVHLLLQRKVISRRYTASGMTPDGKFVTLENLRVRLSPYYVMTRERSRLAGMMVTLLNSIKVHTCQDAVYTLGVASA